MSSRMFQSVIMQMKDATDRMLGVIDAEGFVVACSEPSMIGEKLENPVLKLNAAPESLCIADKKTYKALASWGAYFEFAVFVDGEG